MFKSYIQTFLITGVLYILMLLSLSTYSDLKHAVPNTSKNCISDTYRGTLSQEERIIDYIKIQNKELSTITVKKIAENVIKQHKEQKLPIGLMLGLIKVESSFKQHAKSVVGAVGFWQVMPNIHHDKVVAYMASGKIKTADLYDVDTNSTIGGRILKDCLNKHKNVKMSLLCYNGSQDDVEQTYANKVLKSIPRGV